MYRTGNWETSAPWPRPLRAPKLDAFRSFLKCKAPNSTHGDPSCQERRGALFCLEAGSTASLATRAPQLLTSAMPIRSLLRPRSRASGRLFKFGVFLRLGQAETSKVGQVRFVSFRRRRMLAAPFQQDAVVTCTASSVRRLFGVGGPWASSRMEFVPF